MKNIISSLLIGCILFLTGCSSTEHRNQITAQQFKADHKRVILANLALPEGLTHRDDARDFYYSALNDLFQENGFEVIGKDIYFDAFYRHRDEAGGFFDRHTGDFNQKKFNEIKSNTLHELKSTHQANSVVYFSVEIRRASFGDYRATWDGQSEPYEKNNSDVANFLSSIFRTTSGHLPALSLFVSIENIDMQELYFGAGGIQLIQKLNNDNKFEPVPIDSLLIDPVAMNFSVHEAMRKLLNVPQS